MLVDRLARDGMEATVATPRARWLDRQVAGMTLILAGTAADSAAGWLVLTQSDARGLLVHILAILSWSLGMGLIHPLTAPAPPSEVDGAESSRPAQTAPRPPSWTSGGMAPEINERTLVALMLGLALLPGMAPLGWLLGLSVGAAYRLIQRVIAGSAVPTLAAAQDAPSPPTPILPLSVVEQLIRTGVEPLVNVVSDPSVEMRRGAIAILGKQSGPEAVELLRRFLTDEHADVRLDASVTLSRLEAHAAQAVNEASEQRAMDYAAARRYAGACFEYASSGLLDAVSARFYFTEACAALREYLAHESEDTKGWIALARVLQILGEAEEALAALERARALAPESSEAYVLSLEIAFHERAWTTLRALACEAQASLAISDPVAIAARWWSEPVGELDAIEIPTSGSEDAAELAARGWPLLVNLDTL